MSGALIPLLNYLPESFTFTRVSVEDVIKIVPVVVDRWAAFSCVICGLWSGLIIGWITEIYTSNAYSPV
jgi:Na+/H+-translocating membrane pyrophosphatase